jgi:CheY-like chemotaxis protein
MGEDEDRRTVLLVEDEPLLRTTLARLLGQTYVVREARDGLDALAVLDALDERPSAIVLDLKMPRMDGYGLVRALKGRVRYACIPMIVMSGAVDATLPEGASAVVHKPARIEDLMKALNQVLG